MQSVAVFQNTTRLFRTYSMPPEHGDSNFPLVTYKLGFANDSIAWTCGTAYDWRNNE